MNHGSKRDDPFIIFYLTFKQSKEQSDPIVPLWSLYQPKYRRGKINFRGFQAFYEAVKFEICYCRAFSE